VLNKPDPSAWSEMGRRSRSRPADRARNPRRDDEQLPRHTRGTRHGPRRSRPDHLCRLLETALHLSAITY
jgi:hypothetical protein